MVILASQNNRPKLSPKAHPRLAEHHCQVDNFPLLEQVVFTWLDEILNHIPHASTLRHISNYWRQTFEI